MVGRCRRAVRLAGGAADATYVELVYEELAADPVAAALALFERLGLEHGAEVRTRLQSVSRERISSFGPPTSEAAGAPEPAAVGGGRGQAPEAEPGSLKGRAAEVVKKFGERGRRRTETVQALLVAVRAGDAARVAELTHPAFSFELRSGAGDLSADGDRGREALSAIGRQLFAKQAVSETWTVVSRGRDQRAAARHGPRRRQSFRHLVCGARSRRPRRAAGGDQRRRSARPRAVRLDAPRGRTDGRAMTEQVGAVADELAEETVHPAEGMRVRTARGVLINTAFRIALAIVGLARNAAFAIFLTREEYGLWGLVLTTLITIAFLKQIGISDKFVQQREPDQEAAFQKAFSLELAYSGIFYVFAIVAIPVYALLIYGQPGVLLPGLALSLSLLASAFQSPVWIFYRRMEYARQRSLEAIDPVITTVVTIGLLAVGVGIWGLVIGSLLGSAAAAVAAIAVSPYRLRWRFDRATLSEYVSFSWPLLISGLGSLAVVQGALIVGEAALGLAAVGVIGLAGNIAGFGSRVELLLRNTIYPAVAARRDRLDLLRETFEKSNRIGLMWALPFGFALALFAGDLVDSFLGSEWSSAIPVLRVFGLIFGFGTIGFAWGTMYQATGDTRPLAVSTAVTVAVFFAVTVPLMETVGTMGYAYGMSAAVVAQLIVRGVYLRRLFEGFSLARHTIRSLLPSVIPVAAVLASRLLIEGDRTGGHALAELGGYFALTIVCTAVFERALLSEALGYLRSAAHRTRQPAAGVAG